MLYTAPMLQRLTLSDFSAHLGESFRVQFDSRPDLELVLAEATPLGTLSATRQAFSLVFRGPGGLYLPQRIYRLEHPALGELEIFLVPLAPDAQGSRFEAIFT